MNTEINSEAEQKLLQLLMDAAGKAELALSGKQFGVANEWQCHAAGAANCIVALRGVERDSVFREGNKLLKEVMPTLYK